VAVAWGKALERMDSALRQWPAAGVSLLILTIALGATVFAR
jgi:multicomponent Na+:H+ antiporter subunit A